MNVQVKICGIRTLKAAKAAIDAGADFLGFNFVPTSKRYIAYEKARKIIDYVSCEAQRVGVFQNAKLEEVNQIAKDLGLDFVQLHGNETPVYCSEIESDLIKVFTLSEDFDPEKIINGMKRYSQYVNYFMIDKQKSANSRMLDLLKSKKIANTFPLIFAGNLKVNNVEEVIKTVNPMVVDVAGGVETNGAQDLEKIKLFIQNTKGDIL